MMDSTLQTYAVAISLDSNSNILNLDTRPIKHDYKKKKAY